MILHYGKSLCVHKVHPHITSIITFGYTTICYIHYRIIICLVICVITTFLFNEKCLLMPHAKPLLCKSVIVCTYTLLKSIFSVITYYVFMYNAFVLILSSLKLTTLSLICDFEASRVHSSIYINWNTFNTKLFAQMIYSYIQNILILAVVRSFIQKHKPCVDLLLNTKCHINMTIFWVCMHIAHVCYMRNYHVLCNSKIRLCTTASTFYILLSYCNSWRDPNTCCMTFLTTDQNLTFLAS